MAQIDQTYFIRDIRLPVDQVATELTQYINSYEPEILIYILGYDLYKQYIAGIGAGSPQAKWTALRDGKEYEISGTYYKWRGFLNANKESLIANYVWYQFTKSDYWQTGFRKLNTENAELINPRNQQAKVYNQMVDWIKEMDTFIINNSADYPTYSPTIIKKVNIFNI